MVILIITDFGGFFYIFSIELTLETVSLPNSIASIGEMTFYVHPDDRIPPRKSHGLTAISFPSNITEIGYCAFAGNRLSQVTVPATVTNMGERTFTRCVNLTTVRIEATEIPQFAFVSCPNLQNVTLSHNVTKIGSHWINYCDRLTQITYEGSLDEWATVVKGGNWDGRGGQLDGTLEKVICLDGYMQFDTETREWSEVRE